MKIPYAWLQSFFDVPLPPPEEVGARLTTLGFEVEGLAAVGKGLQGLVTAKVVRLEALTPSLTLAELSAGGRTGRVVTGAPNLVEGAIVPWAPPGSRLPSGQELSVRAFQGQDSEGMVCSIAELGLGVEHEEIFLLSPDVAPGLDLCDALGLPAWVLDISLTPDKASYAQSVLGLARELGASLGHAARAPEVERRPLEGEVPVRVHDPSDCTAYCGGSMNAHGSRLAPMTMRMRLMLSGLRSHSALVDVTNYVMWELGQPLHAFDADRIEPPVEVRRAAGGEELTTLDGEVRRLTRDDVVIADQRGAIALAGVMGGWESAIGSQTRRVFLESARFSPVAVRKMARRFGLSSEAAARFEKGVDPTGQETALMRALDVLRDMGFEGDRFVASWRAPLEDVRTLRLPVKRLSTLLGTSLPAGAAAGYLSALGIETQVAEHQLVATVPPRRYDLQRPVDLVEEIARLHGLDRLPEALPDEPTIGRRSGRLEREEEARDLLLAMGYFEALSYSMVGPDAAAPFGAGGPRLRNPLREEESQLRASLLPGLFEAAARNVRRQQSGLRLFEIGRVFAQDEEGVVERRHLALVALGPLEKPWNGPAETPDFYRIKGVALTLLERLGIAEPRVEASTEAFLHPGRQAAIWSGSTRLGVIGQSAPGVEASFDLPEAAWVAEVDLDAVEAAREGRRHAFTPRRYPAVQRDIAVTFPEEIFYDEVKRRILEVNAPNLASASLFDVYRGPGTAEGEKSLALSLTFVSPEGTLRDTAVDAQISAILEALAPLGGRLRS